MRLSSSSLTNGLVAAAKGSYTTYFNPLDVYVSWYRGSSVVKSSEFLLKLPDELMVEIFLHYRNAQYNYLFIGAKESGTKGTNKPARQWWHVLTFVCRHWRDIVLTTPLLWSLIDPDAFSRPRVVDLIILRSQKTPLDVYATKSSTERSDLDLGVCRRQGESLKQILQESYRIRVLQIQIPWYIVTQTIMEEPSFQAFSMLEELKISTLYTSDEDDGTIPSLLLLRTTKSLQRFSFTYIPINFNILTQSPRSITSLILGHGYFRSCDDLLDVIERLPLLEDLVLNLCDYPTPTDEVSKKRKPVEMGNLKTFHLDFRGSPDQGILTSLPFLSLPPEVSVHIEMHVYFTRDFQPASYPLTFSPIRHLLSHERYLQEEIRATIQVTDVYKGGRFCVTIAPAVGTLDDGGPRDAVSRLYFHSAVLFKGFRSLVDHSVSDAIEGLSSQIFDVLAELSFEQLDGEDPVQSLGQSFAQTISMATNLRLLQAEIPYMNHFLSALFPTGDGLVPVPKLHKLKVMGHSWDSRYHLDDDVLYACLKSRSESGFRLSELELESCKLQHPEPEYIHGLLDGVVDKLIIRP